MAKEKFKDDKLTDDQIEKEINKDAKKATKPDSEKVDFKAEIAYAALYPQGFRSSYQFVPVNIIFDGRTYKLSPAVAKFVKKKIEAKAIAELNKKRTFGKPDNPKIGDYEAS